ncbi:MAG TPA: aromatic amino acid lyase, partial [Desulfobacteria bacterium]|nr:aromatic amino acid lyase [Desulfobacteria bacterium]
MKSLVLNGDQLTLDDAVSALQSGVSVKISSEAKQKVTAARLHIDAAIREKKLIYGITTGFGAFSDVTISRAQGKQLQKNILMSHAAGVGNPLADDIVRCVLLMMINSKAKGHSGLRPKTLDTLLKLFNKKVVPVVPEQGSVGASGDLAPLAHLSLVLIGRGQARYQGQTLSGALALKRAGITPVELAEGEGLALVNGTQVMTAVGALTLHRAIQ